MALLSGGKAGPEINAALNNGPDHRSPVVITSREFISLVAPHLIL